MGDVITLLQRKRTPGPRAASEPAATAQILFYTGVRYQRMTEPAPTNGLHPSEGGMGAKRKRKRG